MLKRTFIPPEFRPYVRGSQLSSQNSLFDEWFGIISDDRKRRALIVELIGGKTVLPHLDAEWVRKTLSQMFPHLGGNNA